MLKFFDSFSADTIFHITLIFIILSLSIALVVCIYYLIKKERSIKLMQFTLLPVGVKFTITVDKKKKQEILLNEIILLRKEIDLLKSSNNKLTFNLFLIYMLIAITTLIQSKRIENQKDLE